jgi:hypothetical protein
MFHTFSIYLTKVNIMKKREKGGKKEEGKRRRERGEGKEEEG